MDNKSQLAVNKHLVRIAIRKVSELWGGDDAKFLDEITEEIIHDNIYDLPKLIAYYNNLMNENVAQYFIKGSKND